MSCENCEHCVKERMKTDLGMDCIIYDYCTLLGTGIRFPRLKSVFCKHFVGRVSPIRRMWLE